MGIKCRKTKSILKSHKSLAANSFFDLSHDVQSLSSRAHLISNFMRNSFGLPINQEGIKCYAFRKLLILYLLD